MPSMESLLKEVRKRLVQTGGRNRLIHVNRSAKRGNLLNIVNERSDDVFSLLRSGGRKMRFAPTGEEDDGDGEDGVVLELPEEEFDPARFKDSMLETPLAPDALQKRLLHLARDAKTAEEEQGINILFLALGFLRWREQTSSSIQRESPLILLPVELVRNSRTSTFDIRCRDDDLVANLPLQERMKQDFGLSIPDIDDAEGWTPSGYFSNVADAVSGKERWEIDPDGMQLGFFSFAKLVMMRDLELERWGEGSPLKSGLVGGLLRDGFEPAAPLFGEDANLDDALPPERIFHVVDADPSQTKVIEETRAGRSLVVQGPPGTGKSQTITNILAAAAHSGKKVLFMAEKMAALEVVHKRMRKAGLADLCLELHSRSANKKRFFQLLGETISRGAGPAAPAIDVQDLKDARDELNRITTALHSDLPDRDYSPYTVVATLAKLVGDDAAPPRINITAAEKSITPAKEQVLFEELRKYLAIIREHGGAEDNPFHGADRLNLGPTDRRRLRDETERADGLLAEWTGYLSSWESLLGAEPAPTLADADRLRRMLEHLKAPPDGAAEHLRTLYANAANARFSEALALADDWTRCRERLSGRVRDAAWRQELGRLRPALADGADSWLSRFFGGYRPACRELAGWLSAPLPKSPRDRLRLLDDIMEGQEKKRAYEEESGFLKDRLGDLWRGERTPFGRLLREAAWLGGQDGALLACPLDSLTAAVAGDALAPFDPSDFDGRRAELERTLAAVRDRLEFAAPDGVRFEALPLADVARRLNGMLENPGMYDVWARYRLARERLLEFPLLELLKLTDDGAIGLDDAETELRYALYEARWKHALRVRPELEAIQHRDRHELVRKFMECEKRHISSIGRMIREKHLSQIPRGSAGEMRLIRGEIAKRTRHRPIRWTMEHAGGMVQRIKPVFLMSPVSVAQFLPPGKVEFDLLVIDEASQVRPEDALGSIARAKQIVVVGDQHQLPPTMFFERLTGNEEDNGDGEDATGARATEMESILTLCEARSVGQRMLEWHYRSRDPSLITVSNDEFYENRLILPPCPTQDDDAYGLRLRRVPGVYRAGRRADNQIEAEHVARRLREIAQNRPDCSVGIVTFSMAQADMMTDVLEMARRRDPLLDAFLAENKPENVFVKNIENVQGDERDIILISVGYGPRDPGGRLARMTFGPVSNDGGERRLNVLFTRARLACEAFVSFDPADIDLRRARGDGPRVLKKFLRYAESGELDQLYVSRGGADSPFEEDVAAAVRRLGYDAAHQVGTAGFRIDIGVKDPDDPVRYMLAVECDGASYHSSLSARQRDRQRQEVLEGFGWRFHRIWSTDWFYRREHEIERLRGALDQAKLRKASAVIKGANADAGDAGEDAVPDDDPDPAPPKGGVGIKVPKYQSADMRLSPTLHEPHELPVNQAAEVVCAVVQAEGPVHADVVTRRYAAAHDKSRAGSRIRRRVDEALARAKKSGRLLNRGEFWGTEEQFADAPVRDRGEAPPPADEARCIPPDEIVACARLIEKECGGVETEELIRVIARTLGFGRTGADLEIVIRKALDLAT